MLLFVFKGNRCKVFMFKLLTLVSEVLGHNLQIPLLVFVIGLIFLPPTSPPRVDGRASFLDKEPQLQKSVKFASFHIFSHFHFFLVN